MLLLLLFGLSHAMFLLCVFHVDISDVYVVTRNQDKFQKKAYSCDK